MNFKEFMLITLLNVMCMGFVAYGFHSFRLALGIQGIIMFYHCFGKWINEK